MDQPWMDIVASPVAVAIGTLIAAPFWWALGAGPRAWAAAAFAVVAALVVKGAVAAKTLDLSIWSQGTIVAAVFVGVLYSGLGSKK
jgi:hypothetical protein